MPIDFFLTTCKFSSDSEEFGLCDDPPPATNPAYIDENDTSKWIATVKNSRKRNIDFFAIDNCVEVLKPDGTKESRCDGLLRHDSNIVFVELKNRGTSGWLKKGCNQIAITHGIFVANNDISKFKLSEAYVSNKQRPLVPTNISNHIQQIKDDTGMILKVESTITI